MADEFERPFPEPPVFGWYPEDCIWARQRGLEAYLNRDGKAGTLRPAARHPKHATPAKFGGTLILRNTSNGNDIRISSDSILGRKPFSDGKAEEVLLEDPTRTVSRSHAMICFDEQENAYVKDLNSLNGTFVIEGPDEKKVSFDEPIRLGKGMLLRMGDEFYEVSIE